MPCYGLLRGACHRAAPCADPLVAMTLAGVQDLSRGADFPTLLALRFDENPGFRGGRFATDRLSSVAIEVLAVQLHAVRVAVQLFCLFPCLRRLLFGFLQSLSLRLGFQAQPFGPRLAALL